MLDYFFFNDGLIWRHYDSKLLSSVLLNTLRIWVKFPESPYLETQKKIARKNLNCEKELLNKHLVQLVRHRPVLRKKQVLIINFNLTTCLLERFH